MDESQSPQQGTEDWKLQRLGKVTASCFEKVLTNGRGGRPSKTAETYMLELIAETLTGLPADEIYSKPLQWGNQHEPSARAFYTWSTGIGVQPVGFVQHPNIDLVGGSPDSLVGDHGLLEIKCPYTSKVHVNTILTGEVPEEYVSQVQGNLWVTGRKWCDFVSFDPRMPNGLDAVVIRVERDHDYIADLETAVLRFITQMEIKLKRLRSKVA